VDEHEIPSLKEFLDVNPNDRAEHLEEAFKRALGQEQLVKALAVDVLAEALERIEYLQLDQLTNCYRREIWCEKAEELLLIEEPITIAMIDLDGLKEANDTHGHKFGDLILSSMAELLSSVIRHRPEDRQRDIIGRYGGDEFVVIFRGIGEEKVSTILRRVAKIYKRRVTRLPELRNKPELQKKTGLSYGCVQAKKGDSLNALLEKADERMYQQKRKKGEI
jgi:diguanylate cyclase (GGDEF)-like protein